METLRTSSVSEKQWTVLAEFAETQADAELRDVLLDVVHRVREGASLVALAPNTTLTPREVASVLGMSRTHVYKLLDSGEIVSERVGRDRRIRLSDLQEFDERRQKDRSELAERFASANKTRSGAIDEIADLL